MKPKIAAIRNEDKYVNIIFLKTQPLLKMLSKVLLGIKAREEIVSDMVTGKCICDIEDMDNVKVQKISKLKDTVFHFFDKDYIINIIFGEKKVFFTGYMKPGLKNKVIKSIVGECEWVKGKIKY